MQLERQGRPAVCAAVKRNHPEEAEGMAYSDIDNDSAWHELLNEKYRAERKLALLVTQVERNHDENHVGNLRWCPIGACRTVADQLKR